VSVAATAGHAASCNTPGVYQVVTALAHCLPSLASSPGCIGGVTVTVAPSHVALHTFLEWMCTTPAVHDLGDEACRVVQLP
jgi:hypothetical protein